MSIHYVPYKQKMIYSREQFQVDKRPPKRPRCLTIAFLNVCDTPHGCRNSFGCYE
ncbi:hypothetical protein M6B38_178900 [Iris pallida]|uniref:Uncharacterized protein n=1 Tax=Iris pallida TaxID=29817 RepID=A0AAX6EM56_IRIPA|nr:hypothetical protein M6B38_178900 [Iris pallida]